MKLVALTGGIATGKSTVARMFESLGATVLFADRIAHLTYRKGTPLYREIRRRYGAKILDASGRIDRKKLGHILFSSAREKAWLESRIHPATFWQIGQALKRAFARKPKLILVEAALHFETGYHRFFPLTCVVYAGEREQMQRLRQREGLSAAEARLRLQHQMPMARKKKMADFVLDNRGSLAQTRKRVEKLYKRWTR